jgi:hypothetical protein
MVLLHHIHVLIHAPARGKDTLEHLQDARVDTRSVGGTNSVSSVGRSGNRSGGASMMIPRILGHCRVKRLILYILVELVMCHHLNHVLNIRCKSIRSQWVGDDVPNLIHNILKNIKGFMRSTNKFRSYTGIASEYPILGTRVFLIILCSTKK